MCAEGFGLRLELPDGDGLPKIVVTGNQMVTR